MPTRLADSHSERKLALGSRKVLLFFLVLGKVWTTEQTHSSNKALLRLIKQ